MKPRLDTRFGSSAVQSRSGLSREVEPTSHCETRDGFLSQADVLITSETEFPTDMLIGVVLLLLGGICDRV